MITAEGLSFRYPGATEFSLREITCQIPEGTALFLCGTNGSGKSTLLSLLAGLYTPTAGRISVGDVRTPGNEQGLRDCSALVLQDADLQIIGSTVEEDMLLAFPPGLSGAEETARGMAAKFDLAAQWNSPVHTLSYGQKRKLCLAVALLGSPSLLLLDEPLSGLDYPAIREMRALLKKNREMGLTQIISVHDLDPLIDLADSLLVLHKGTQVLFGPPDEILGEISQYGVRRPSGWQRGEPLRNWE